MDSTDIQNKNTVNVYPHIIVTGEFKLHIFSINQSIFRLDKLGRHCHTEMIIYGFTSYSGFYISYTIVERPTITYQWIKREKATRIFTTACIICFLTCSRYIINLKVTSIQIRI